MAESPDLTEDPIPDYAGLPGVFPHALETEPRKHNNIKPLKGKFKGMLRYRVGDYRVVYFIEESRKKVIVSMIAHRSEVYE
ncbi:MAG: type II toxin-antitoxin system mRNA interferase toxin, RelE/StbE family [Planctomycetia bacterium]|nr:type II toxin-antitoxin system mRNA interferase toxin, RelE/StbE family [Planctomycetia bacterium]